MTKAPIGKITDYLSEWSDCKGIERRTPDDTDEFFAFRAQVGQKESKDLLLVEKSVGVDGFVNVFVKEEDGTNEWFDAIPIYPA